jgi:glycosyltransferase involved in cell wall biosynthesis
LADVRHNGVSPYDVVHVHIDPTPKRLAMIHEIGMHTLAVQVLHREPNESEAAALKPHANTLPLIAFSDTQRKRMPGYRWLGVARHGIDTQSLCPRADDEQSGRALVIGKISRGKGTSSAIRAAQKNGLEVDVAGPITDLDYFKTRIEPLLNDGSGDYVGTVSGERKRRLFAAARVVICATRLPETFCLVLAEAMACGTPVASLQNGACNEVVVDGTGFTTPHASDLASIVMKATELNRKKIRQIAVATYSLGRMASDYDKIYRRGILQRRSGTNTSNSTIVHQDLLPVEICS